MVGPGISRHSFKRVMGILREFLHDEERRNFDPLKVLPENSLNGNNRIGIEIEEQANFNLVGLPVLSKILSKMSEKYE